MNDFEKKLMGKRIRDNRKRLGLSQEQLAEILGMKRTNIANYEAGRIVPPGNVVLSLAETFETSTDYILGRSAYAVIEKRLLELGMTEKDLEDKLELPSGMIESLDTLPPAPWDYEREGIINKIADELKMDFSTLASAYSRQEPPAYDGSEDQKTASEDFKPETIAAHHDGEEWTEEELEEIEEFKRFVAMRREARKRKKGE